jgi:protein O-GlcNAc transferase
MKLVSQHFPNLLDLCAGLYRAHHYTESVNIASEVLKLHSGEKAFLHVISLGEIKRGNLDRAEQAIRQGLSLDENDASSWNILGDIYRRKGNKEEAKKCFLRTIELDSEGLDGFCNLGNLYEELSNDVEAEKTYRYIIGKNPEHAEAHYNLGNCCAKCGRYEEAETWYKKAIELKPDAPDFLNNYGSLLIKLGRVDEGLQLVERCVSLSPNSAQHLCSLGAALTDAQKGERAREVYNQALSILSDVEKDMALVPIGILEKQRGNKKEAEDYFKKALTINPKNFDAQRGLVNIHLENNNIVTAKKLVDEFSALNPQSLTLLFSKIKLELRVSYETEAQIIESRTKYHEGLLKIKQILETVSGRIVSELESLVGNIQPFYLPYQGMSVVALQKLYGEVITAAMRKVISVPPLTPRPPVVGRKIKVGIASGFLRNHSNYKIPIRGWVKELDKSKFETFAYHMSERIDEQTHEATTLFDHFVQGPKSLHAWVDIIFNDNLDVLIYPEIGMDPMIYKLACYRLAPIQANSWGHPVTSGMPMIDYYLSSDLMESSDADKEYSEKLVRLPNLSISYDPPKRTRLPLSRANVGIRSDAIVYWCCQVIYKYLPQFDWIYAEIASRNKNAQIVFITIQPDSEAAHIFKRRMTYAFKQRGANPDTQLLFLSALLADQFSTVASLCDICLDSFEWSGCNSTFETLAQGVPVVTCLGQFMRGKHTGAILKMIECTELIAKTPQQYIELAVELGLNEKMRKLLSDKITQKLPRAYNDLTCVRGLEKNIEAWVGKI